MDHARTRSRRPLVRRLILALGAAAVIGGVAAGPALADDDGWHRGHDGWREHQWREHAWREHEWRDGDWRWRRPYAYVAPGYVAPGYYAPGYYAPPPVYMPAPPPPAYYVPPPPPVYYQPQASVGLMVHLH